MASGANFTVGNGLRACTAEVKETPLFTVSLQGRQRQVALIDTPGFDDTTRSDSEVLKLIALYLYET